MADAAEQYVKEIRKRFKYHPTWAPGTPLRLGDVGVISDHTFVRRSTISALGIPRGKVRRDNSSDDEWQYESSREVRWTAKAGGEVNPNVPNVPKLKAGASINFGREGAVVFSLRDVTVTQIEDVVAVEDAMWELLERDAWDEDWAVVTELVVAKKATILISSGGDASVQLMATGSAKAGPAELGDLSGSFKMVSKHGMHTAFLNDTGLTPLFRVIKFHQDFWTGGRDIKEFRAKVSSRLLVDGRQKLAAAERGRAFQKLS